MGLQQTYAGIVVPPARIVLGVRLQEYTLGHALLMERLEVDVDAGWGSLALAVWICSRPWYVARLKMGSRKETLRRKWWLWRTYTLLGERGMALAGETLQAYFEDAWDIPAFWDKVRSRGGDDEGQTPAKCEAPLLLRLRMLWVQQFGMNADQVLDLPMRRALWDSAARLESEGHVEWVGDADLDVIAPEASPA